MPPITVPMGRDCKAPDCDGRWVEVDPGFIWRWVCGCKDRRKTETGHARQLRHHQQGNGNMIELNLKMARELVEAFGGDEDAVMSLVNGDENSHSGPGVYVGSSEYPEEGSNYLGSVEG